MVRRVGSFTSQEMARMTRKTLKLTVSLALSALASTALAAFPEAPIQLIVPFPPGGSVDPIARALQEGMQDKLSTSVIVVNQPGAGGTLGTAKVALAEPTGYTLGVTTVGPLATQPHLQAYR